MCRSALSLQCELAHIAAHLILIPGERRAPLPRASIAALECALRGCGIQHLELPALNASSFDNSSADMIFS